ncbi:hypothetical protein [Burkholderia guangdongensis]|uniref:hypothetical protein n=1 Tax=Burkholderia guangdongensis TaxID=1792500 RepID=UPI001FEC21E6|nr:hypothetical protein [Burkholderia guangdongensis]
MMFASTLSMNSAQATISGAMKAWAASGMGGMRGKDAIMQRRSPARHASARAFEATRRAGTILRRIVKPRSG